MSVSPGRNLIALLLHNLSTLGHNVFGAMSPRVDVVHKTPQQNQIKIKPSTTSEDVAIAKFEEDAQSKVGQGEMPHRLIRKSCRYSSLEKYEDAFDTALR